MRSCAQGHLELRKHFSFMTKRNPEEVFLSSIKSFILFKKILLSARGSIIPIILLLLD